MARRAVHTPAVPRVAFVDATSVDYAAAEQYAPNPCLFGHPSLYSHPVVTPRDARCAPPRTPSTLVAFPMGAVLHSKLVKGQLDVWTAGAAGQSNVRE